MEIHLQFTSLLTLFYGNESFICVRRKRIGLSRVVKPGAGYQNNDCVFIQDKFNSKGEVSETQWRHTIFTFILMVDGI